MGGEEFVTVVGRGLVATPWPVLTLHAEVEGGGFLWVAERLLALCDARGVRCRPLSEMAASVRGASAGTLPSAEIALRHIRGRAGRVAMPVGLEPLP
jgi:hypothetical protein